VFVDRTDRLCCVVSRAGRVEETRVNANSARRRHPDVGSSVNSWPSTVVDVPTPKVGISTADLFVFYRHPTLPVRLVYS